MLFFPVFTSPIILRYFIIEESNLNNYYRFIKIF
jgi:hypothetical protein